MRLGLGDQVVYAGGNPCFDERAGTYTCGPNAPPAPAPFTLPSWVKWAALGMVVLLVVTNE